MRVCEKIWWFGKVANMYQELAKAEKDVHKRIELKQKAKAILADEAKREGDIDLEVDKRIHNKIDGVIKEKKLTGKE